MAAHLNCDKCMELWKDYARLSQQSRAEKVVAERAIIAHEAVAHALDDPNNKFVKDKSGT